MLALNENYLLAHLDSDIQKRLFTRLEEVELSLGDVVYEPGSVISHVYFPTSAVISLVYVLENGASAAMAIAGKDGLVGISLFLGQGGTNCSAVVQNSGKAFRLKRQYVSNEFDRHGIFMHRILLYTQALITQMAQTAVCNRHHSILQRLCRWLLLSLDRLPHNKVEITQEWLAFMLGVRREGVTEAACRLKKMGAIEYCRGHITIVDRAKLENTCCECYEFVKNQSNTLLNFSTHDELVC